MKYKDWFSNLEIYISVFSEIKEFCSELIRVYHFASDHKKTVETVRIYPKNLILGIGCRRGIETEIIMEGIGRAMEAHNLSVKSIKRIATVDLKADEVGIIESSKLLKKELVIISREEIKKVEDRFEGSEFVKKQIGVSCVSEPCALLASNGKGKFIENKFIYNGMTVSIYEESFNDE